jgi:hypothetical protein
MEKSTKANLNTSNGSLNSSDDENFVVVGSTSNISSPQTRRLALAEEAKISSPLVQLVFDQFKQKHGDRELSSSLQYIRETINLIEKNGKEI